MKYVSLRTSTHFTIGESIIKVPDLIDFCSKNNLPYVAFCYKMNLFGDYEFVTYAIKKRLNLFWVVY